jgi:hypothetical protein
MTIRRTKTTDTHSEYVILIALPLQQWLHERTSMLCYMYIGCLFDSGIRSQLEIVRYVGMFSALLYGALNQVMTASFHTFFPIHTSH